MNTVLTWGEVAEPFVELLGVTGVEFSGGQGEAELALEARLTNRVGKAHGGTLVTLLDFVMAQACRSADASQRPAITVELKSTFIRPGEGKLRCIGQCIHHGRSIAFGEACVVDEKGTIVATGSGTFKYAAP